MNSVRKIVFLAAIGIVTLGGCKQKDPEVAPVPVLITTTGIEMVKIEGGSFEMGSPDGQDDEQPLHIVSVDSFLMDRYEVTQECFKKMQMPDPSHFKNPNGPVDQANWTDAVIFCNERSLAEGFKPCYDEETWQCNFDANGYRLPTEAEWEYACRAGTKTKYGFGDNKRKLGDYAWYADNSGGKTHTVGTRKANPLGLYDIHGNVVEWCEDYYSQTHYAQSQDKNPRGPKEGEERVLRGGGWNSTADACRSTYRASDPSIDDTCLANDAIGFRCVRSSGPTVKE